MFELDDVVVFLVTVPLKFLYGAILSTLSNSLNSSNLYFLLPIFGLTGFILAIMISEIFNFCISYFQLYKATGFKIPFSITCCYLFFGILGLYNIFKS